MFRKGQVTRCGLVALYCTVFLNIVCHLKDERKCYVKELSLDLDDLQTKKSKGVK